MTQNTKQTNKTLWKVVKLSELFWERKTTLQEQEEDTKGGTRDPGYGIAPSRLRRAEGDAAHDSQGEDGRTGCAGYWQCPWCVSVMVEGSALHGLQDTHSLLLDSRDRERILQPVLNYIRHTEKKM